MRDTIADFLPGLDLAVCSHPSVRQREERPRCREQIRSPNRVRGDVLQPLRSGPLIDMGNEGINIRLIRIGSQRAPGDKETRQASMLLAKVRTITHLDPRADWITSS